MAARLIQRASRLLAVPAFFQPPPSSSAPTECMRLCQHTPSPPCQVALHTTPLRYLVEILPEISQSPPNPQEDEFFSMLKAMPGVNELLEIPRKQKVNENQGVLIIKEIAKREASNNDEVLMDPRFQQLLDLINGQIQKIWNTRLISLLKSLITLGVPTDDRYLQSLEIELHWRLRKFSIEHLAQLASNMPPLPRFKEEKMLLDDLVKQVELRWMEIREMRTLVVMITRLGFLSNSLMERLEDKVLELAGNLTPKESRKVISALAAANRRSLPILRALSFHLVQFKGELSPTVTSDLVYAFAQLNFCQPQALQKMAADIMPKLEEMKPSDISMIVRSLAHLRYYNQPLCEAIAQVCVQRSQSFSPVQLSHILLGFARLNFQPGQSEEFFNMIHQCVGTELGSLSWQLQLDVVWSLCTLSQVTTPYFQKALTTQVYNQIKAAENAKKSVFCFLDLMQINTTARLESPEYRGPLLHKDVLQKLHSWTQAKTTSPLQSAVIETLKKVFPDPETCNYNVSTIYGCHLDGQVVLDSDLKALPLKDFEDPNDLQSKGTKPLPAGARRVAIVSQEFTHFTFRGKELVGRYAMRQRHLRAAGFLLVEVPYYDWKELKSDREKQSFLTDQIKKVMAEDMAQ